MREVASIRVKIQSRPCARKPEWDGRRMAAGRYVGLGVSLSINPGYTLCAATGA
jgi:hypothetical protein